MFHLDIFAIFYLLKKKTLCKNYIFIYKKYRLTLHFEKYFSKNFKFQIVIFFNISFFSNQV